ncbi:MAG: sce7725 family protein [Steroidobacteraceae bacterium]
MYHPYFRGKQYELITIREMAALLKAANFRPIIEPVRETLGGLQKALDAVVEEQGRAIVIVNPHHGDLSEDGEPLTALLKEKFALPGISAGILLKQDTTLDEAIECYEAHANHAPSFIHAGFTDPKALATKLGNPTQEHCHIFFDRFCGKLYQKHFKGAHRVLLRDGFEKKRNADYDPIEPFSDLHVTFIDEGMNGFGDFLIVGDDFSEGGGPAYAVAIHLTFIDRDQDDVMKIYHFVSDSKDTPKDPAGKFAEALAKMMKTLNKRGSKVVETEAVKEFRAFHQQGHFPGLGYVKKLSMNHHIETLAAYLKTAK